MNEYEILSTVFGSILTVAGIILFFLSYKIGWKYMVQEKRCSAKTTGVVKKYGVGASGISSAIVFFDVNGKTYKAKSWTPLFTVQKTIKTPFATNNQTYKEENNIGEFEYKQNSFVNVRVDPTRKKHPKGEILDVWYDPKNPKLCYAERYANKKVIFWILFLGAIFVFAMDILILIVFSMM